MKSPSSKSSQEVTALPQSLQPHLLRKQILEASGGSLYTTVLPSDFCRVVQDTADPESRYPDLIDTTAATSSYAKLAPSGGQHAGTAMSAAVHKVNSESGIGDADMYCTLPRRHHARYRSCDSQSSLLSSGRYGGGSSGEESNAGSRRLSADSQQLFLAGSKRANSYLNLVSHQRQASDPVSPIRELNSATPLLDVSSLEARVREPACTSPSNAYDYHAAQLERFLEEYRSLQKELSKMKESCDSIRQERLLKSQSKLASAAYGAGETLPDDGSNPKSILKKTSTATVASPASVTSPNSSTMQSLSSSTLPHLSRYDSDLAQYWSTRNPFRSD